MPVVYDAVTNTFGNSWEESDEPIVYESELHMIDGKETELFAIGYMSWTWEVPRQLQ